MSGMRRAIVTLVTVIVALVGIAAGAVAWHVATDSLHAAAYSQEYTSAHRLVTALDDRTSMVAQAKSTVVGAQSFLARPRPAYVPAAAFAGLKQTSDALHATVTGLAPTKPLPDRTFAATVPTLAMPWDTLATT
jgi:hypothetical protein